MDRVVVTVRVEARDVVARLEPPPDAGEPSALWMERLASLMRGEGGELRCCLPGTLEEVSSHLWQHQVLWMHLRFPAAERHVAVQLSDLLEPGADFSSGRFSSVVTLQEEDSESDDAQGITVGIELEDAAIAADPPPPSLAAVFELDLEVTAPEAPPQELRLRCSGVEQPLRRGMRHTLVLVQSWSEVPQALEELGACVQVPSEPPGSFEELPLDLAALGAAAARGGTGTAEAEVASAPLRALGGAPLRLLARVRSSSCDTNAARLPGPSRDMELHARSVLVEPHVWRVSVEVRSVRLTTRNANVFVTYSYSALRQPRPFRTNPPTLARRNTTVYLPHAFAAYTLVEAEGALREALEEPLRVELWARDIYRKDGPIGFVEAAIAPVFDQAWQESSSMPSMVHGFRALDQVCQIIGCDSPEPRKIGALRVVVFLEDLGFAGGQTPSPPKSSAAPRAPPTPAPMAVAPVAPAAPPAPPAPATVAALSARLPVAEAADMAARTPAHFAAFELEIWKRAEEEKFRARLSEREAAMRERVEEEYRQREAARAAEFERTYAELRAVEAKVRQKLQQLHQREASIAAAEARASAQVEEERRSAEAAAREREDVVRRQVAEAQQELELERARARRLQERAAEVEDDLAAARQRAADVEAELEEVRRKLASGPLAQSQRELQAAQLQLREQHSRMQALVASRDHFRSKVEELCARLVEQQPAALPAADPRPSSCTSTSAPRPAALCAEDSGAEVTTALRRIQEDLAQLARDWDEGPRRPYVAQAGAGRPAAPQEAGEHLAWLLKQREELLESGVYTRHDAVLRALEDRIAAASARAGPTIAAAR